jgi:hypothetical protein
MIFTSFRYHLSGVCEPHPRVCPLLHPGVGTFAEAAIRLGKEKSLQAEAQGFCALGSF